jgi:hypothetical protein
MNLDREKEEEKERALLDLAERFRAAADPHEVGRLGDELGRFIFGQ